MPVGLLTTLYLLTALFAAPEKQTKPYPPKAPAHQQKPPAHQQQPPHPQKKARFVNQAFHVTKKPSQQPSPSKTDNIPLQAAPIDVTIQLCPTCDLLTGCDLELAAATAGGIPVTVVDPATGVQQSQVTDSDGKVVFTDLPSGIYVAESNGQTIQFEVLECNGDPQTIYILYLSQYCEHVIDGQICYDCDGSGDCSGNSRPAANKQIRVQISDNSYTAITDSNGFYSLQFTGHGDASVSIDDFCGGTVFTQLFVDPIAYSVPFTYAAPCPEECVPSDVEVIVTVCSTCEEGGGCNPEIPASATQGRIVRLETTTGTVISDTVVGPDGIARIFGVPNPGAYYLSIVDGPAPELLFINSDFEDIITTTIPLLNEAFCTVSINGTLCIDCLDNGECLDTDIVANLQVTAVMADGTSYVTTTDENGNYTILFHTGGDVTVSFGPVCGELVLYSTTLVLGTNQTIQNSVHCAELCRVPAVLIGAVCYGCEDEEEPEEFTCVTPAANVTVEVRQGNQIIGQLTTNDTGFFEANVPDVGDYDVIVFGICPNSTGTGSYLQTTLTVADNTNTTVHRLNITCEGACDQSLNISVTCNDTCAPSPCPCPIPLWSPLPEETRIRIITNENGTNVTLNETRLPVNGVLPVDELEPGNYTVIVEIPIRDAFAQLVGWREVAAENVTLTADPSESPVQVQFVLACKELIRLSRVPPQTCTQPPAKPCPHPPTPPTNTTPPFIHRPRCPPPHRHCGWREFFQEWNETTYNTTLPQGTWEQFVEWYDEVTKPIRLAKLTKPSEEHFHTAQTLPFMFPHGGPHGMPIGMQNPFTQPAFTQTQQMTRTVTRNGQTFVIDVPQQYPSPQFSHPPINASCNFTIPPFKIPEDKPEEFRFDKFKPPRSLPTPPEEETAEATMSFPLSNPDIDELFKEKDECPCKKKKKMNKPLKVKKDKKSRKED